MRWNWIRRTRAVLPDSKPGQRQFSFPARAVLKGLRREGRLGSGILSYAEASLISGSGNATSMFFLVRVNGRKRFCRLPDIG